jgi:hypothetical protein
MIESVLLGDGEGKGAKSGVNVREVAESLDSARDVTRRLAACTQAITNKEANGDPGTEKKNLREEAHLFLKVCFSVVYFNLY